MWNLDSSLDCATMESSIDQFAVGNESNSAIIGDSMKPNGKIVYTIKCTPHPIQPKPRHSSNVNIPTAEGTVNYILVPLPEKIDEGLS